MGSSQLLKVSFAPMFCLMFSFCGQAQAEDKPLEEVVITGSYIKRVDQSDTFSPVLFVSRNTLASSGSLTFADFAPTLTINAGDEGRSDNFVGPRTQGTSNINLRGLGVGANLVLLNGRRQTQAAMTNNDGESFVDTASLVPMIAVERMEILKDGAASLYGSDAISGVVNFITRTDVRSVQLEFDYQIVPDGNQEDYRLGGIWGKQTENTELVVAFSAFDRTRLEITERDLEGQERGDPTGVSSSGFGNPGNFVLSNGTLDVSDDTVVPDPDCDVVAAQDLDGSALGTAVVFGNNQCRWDFHSFLDLVPDETQILGFLSVTQTLGPLGRIKSHRLRADISAANNRSNRRTSPSFGPFSQPVTVPGAHPQNPFGEDVVFFGRVAGTDQPPIIVKGESDTWRVSGVWSGAFVVGDNATPWNFEAAIIGSQNDALYLQEDTVIDAWQQALNNFTYNPFGNAFLVSASDPAANDQAVIESLQEVLTLDAKSKLWTYDTHISGDLFAMPAGVVGGAAGIQYRYERLDYNYDELANNDGYGFFIGNPDFDADRSVAALFVEFVLPLSEKFQLQLAVRHESYSGDVGSTTDPKLALKWQPNDSVILRASFSESFRAPTLFQTDGIGTTPTSGVFALGSFQFPPLRLQADPDDPLKPETADVYSLGVTLQPIPSLTLDLDYWRFEYSDVIIRENEAELVTAALAGDPQALKQVDFDLTTGLLGQIRVFYRNAQALDTSGIDLKVQYAISSGLQLTVNTTWVGTYEFEVNGETIDGSGLLNAGTIGSPSPSWRASADLSWTRGMHNAGVILRYIDGYEDQRSNRRGFEQIDSYTTLNARYQLQLTSSLAFVVGGKNLLDEDVPTVREFMGYDSKTHDARQRMLYLSVKKSFD
jgi:iron complex outermembrane recepter protein